jgi:hypothetical protein
VTIVGPVTEEQAVAAMAAWWSRFGATSHAVRSLCARDWDADDVRSELMLTLVLRMRSTRARHERARGSLSTYVDRVARSRLAHLVARRWTRAASLDDVDLDQEDVEAALPASGTETEARRAPPGHREVREIVAEQAARRATQAAARAARGGSRGQASAAGCAQDRTPREPLSSPVSRAPGSKKTGSP